jgi:hypothetical protein
VFVHVLSGLYAVVWRYGFAAGSRRAAYACHGGALLLGQGFDESDSPKMTTAEHRCVRVRLIASV